MIAIAMKGGPTDKAAMTVLAILEPDNLSMLRQGKCIRINLASLCFPDLKFPLDVLLEFTPDQEWLADEFKRRGQLEGEDIVELLREGRSRADVCDRPQHPAEVVYDELLGKRGPQ